MPPTSTPRRATRYVVLGLTLLAWAGFGWLALHRSGDPVVLGRYSAPYALLVAFALVACAAFSFVNTRRGLAWILAWRRELLLAPASLVLALLLAELTVRVVDPGGISYYAEMRRYEQDRVPDPKLTYRHPRATTRRYEGVEVRYNELGLRDDPIGPKAPGEFRVMVLGDSLVYGWGVPQEQTFSSVLQRSLAAELGRPVRVINTGVCSYNTQLELAWLREHGFALAPDLVVLVYVSNDILTTQSIWSPAGVAGRSPHRLADFVFGALKHSWLYRLAAHARGTRGWQTVPGDPSEPGWQASMAALRELVGDARARDVGVAFFFWSWVVDASHGALREAVRGAVAPAAVEDIGSWFEGRDVRQLMNSRIDPHPSAEAHALLAARMLEALRALGLLPERAS